MSGMKDLSRFAVDFRYPGDSADKELAREALDLCRQIRRIIRRGFGLEE
jgi:hypothetical protein